MGLFDAFRARDCSPLQSGKNRYVVSSTIRCRTRTRFVSCLASLLVVCTAAGVTADDQATPAAEAAIRANVDAFVKAYNARDAKAIAELFTPEGQLLDENDHTTHGRDAIEQAFASVFAASPQGRIEVHVGSIRLFGSALAVETGTTHVTDRPGAEPDVTRYTVVHTKSLDGKWQMAFARDTSLTQEGNARGLFRTGRRHGDAWRKCSRSAGELRTAQAARLDGRQLDR